MITAFEDFPFVVAGFCDAKESPALECPILMKQVHSVDVLVLNQAPKLMPECDALATIFPDLKLTVKTADCAPVLFLDPTSKVIAAAHAGWKGAFQGILETTVLTMLKMGATIPNIHVAVGPHLTKKSFQVSPEMQALFPKTEHHFFAQTDAGIYFDFSAYIHHRLTRIGLNHITIHAIDTMTDLSYNSYRRDKENPARQYSFIQLKQGVSYVR